MNNNSYNVNTAVKKKKRKFNFIDLLIVLVILAVVGIIAYVFSPWGHIEKLWSKDTAELTYLVEIKDVDINYIEKIREGDSAVNAVTKNSMGKIAEVVSVESAYVYDYALDENGEMRCVVSEKPNKFNVTVKIVAEATYTKNVGYSVNGCRVAIGESFDLRFPLYSCVGYCTQMYS